MVKVIFKDDEFLIEGTFSMGISGIHEDIGFEYGFKELAQELEINNYEWIQPLKPYFEGVEKNGDAYAKALEKFINEKEEFVQKNIKQINDYFLYRLVDNFYACGYPFWEVKEAILPEFSDYDFEDIYDDDGLNETISNLDKEYYNTPNDNSMEKTDVEAFVRKQFPMFNWDKLIETIIPEGIYFDGAWMSVQFSDNWGYNLYCSAYEKFDENLKPTDWHNF